MLPLSNGTKVETSPSFDRNWYRAQTFLQAILALVILSGLLGVFGGGWLSTDVVRIGPVEVTYDRFARKTVPFRITLRSSGERATGPLLVSLSGELTERAGIIRSVPTAASSKETPFGTEFVFPTDARQAHVVISVQPDRFGIFTWKLKIDGAGEASLFQIIYP